MERNFASTSSIATLNEVEQTFSFHSKLGSISSPAIIPESKGNLEDQTHLLKIQTKQLELFKHDNPNYSSMSGAFFPSDSTIGLSSNYGSVNSYKLDSPTTAASPPSAIFTELSVVQGSHSNLTSSQQPSQEQQQHQQHQQQQILNANLMYTGHLGIPLSHENIDSNMMDSHADELAPRVFSTDELNVMGLDLTSNHDEQHQSQPQENHHLNHGLAHWGGFEIKSPDSYDLESPTHPSKLLQMDLTKFTAVGSEQNEDGIISSPWGMDVNSLSYSSQYQQLQQLQAEQQQHQQQLYTDFHVDGNSSLSKRKIFFSTPNLSYGRLERNHTPTSNSSSIPSAGLMNIETMNAMNAMNALNPMNPINSINPIDVPMSPLDTMDTMNAMSDIDPITGLSRFVSYNIPGKQTGGPFSTQLADVNTVEWTSTPLLSQPSSGISASSPNLKLSSHTTPVSLSASTSSLVSGNGSNLALNEEKITDSNSQQRQSSTSSTLSSSVTSSKPVEVTAISTLNWLSNEHHSISTPLLGPTSAPAILTTVGAFLPHSSLDLLNGSSLASPSYASAPPLTTYPHYYHHSHTRHHSHSHAQTHSNPQSHSFNFYGLHHENTTHFNHHLNDPFLSSVSDFDQNMNHSEDMLYGPLSPGSLSSSSSPNEINNIGSMSSNPTTVDKMNTLMSSSKSISASTPLIPSSSSSSSSSSSKPLISSSSSLSTSSSSLGNLPLIISNTSTSSLSSLSSNFGTSFSRNMNTVVSFSSSSGPVPGPALPPNRKRRFLNYEGKLNSFLKREDFKLTPEKISKLESIRQSLQEQNVDIKDRDLITKYRSILAKYGQNWFECIYYLGGVPVQVTDEQYAKVYARLRQVAAELPTTRSADALFIIYDILHSMGIETYYNYNQKMTTTRLKYKNAESSQEPKND